MVHIFDENSSGSQVGGICDSFKGKVETEISNCD